MEKINKDVFYDEIINKYRCYLSLKDKRHFIGIYDTFEEAKEARSIAFENFKEG